MDSKDGKGTITTDSGTLKDTQYSFKTRFENGVGTNPEELIAAAHSGCFAMAFSAELGKAGLTPESISATATVTLDKTDDGFYRHPIASGRDGESPRRGQQQSAGNCQRRQGGLPHFTVAERESDDGRESGISRGR